MTVDINELKTRVQIAWGYPLAGRVAISVAERDLLVSCVEAAQRRHEQTGFCPLCEAGPPPHHNEGCALAEFRSVKS